MDKAFQVNVRFDSSTLKRFFHEPERVLSNPEAFWEREKAMHHVRQWHQDANVPVAWNWFKKGAEKIAGLSAAERAAHPGRALAERILKEESRFLEIGLPFIRSYLPGTPVESDITVHLVAYIAPYAFANAGHVVIDPTSPQWLENDWTTTERAMWILNILVHEFWHVGYRAHERLREPLQHEKPLSHDLTTFLQNEGFATYVGYQAQTLFPVKHDADYAMLDAPDSVQGAFADVNDIFSLVGRRAEEEIRRISWDRGVTGRAYYIAGAAMARAIELESGSPALNATVAEGPLAFIEAYNRIAPAGLRIQAAQSP